MCLLGCIYTSQPGGPKYHARSAGCRIGRRSQARRVRFARGRRGGEQLQSSTRFFCLAALNSTGAVPAAVAGAAAKGASALLACAVTATGLRSQMQSLMTAGVRPLAVILLPTLVAFALSLTAAVLLIR